VEDYKWIKKMVTLHNKSRLVNVLANYEQHVYYSYFIFVSINKIQLLIVCQILKIIWKDI